MALLGAPSFCVFLLASAVLGVRLLLLARRTRELPELAIAIAFLAGGVVGYGLMVVCAIVPIVPDAYARPLRYVYVLGLNSGAFAVAVFTRSVFRPDALWGRLLLAAIAAVFGAGVAGTALSPPLPAGTPPAALAFWPNTLGSLASYGWATAEASRYYTMMRRRTRLGLADPAVTHRVLMWSIAAGSTVITALLFVAARFTEARRLSPAALLVTYALILVGAVTNWLVFFPPAAYRRRLQRSAEAQT